MRWASHASHRILPLHGMVLHVEDRKAGQDKAGNISPAAQLTKYLPDNVGTLVGFVTCYSERTDTN